MPPIMPVIVRHMFLWVVALIPVAAVATPLPVTEVAPGVYVHRGR